MSNENLSLEDVPNVFEVSNPDAKQILNRVRKTNFNRLIVGQLNINSVRN